MKKMMFAAAMLGLVTVSQPALAHKVVMDIYSETETVEGEVGFSNGVMAAKIQVDVYDDKGNKLGSTTTDEEGVFVYKPTKSVNHVFRANLGAGHIVESTLAAEDLPEFLAAAAPAGGAAEAKSEAAAAPATAAPAAMEDVNADALRKMISKEVNRAVKPLRKDIIAMREQKELHSILGGIGYIVGIFGLGFFLMARRKNAPTA